jgi:hypothetical protein
MNAAITPHRALSILLYVLSALEALIGLVLIFMTGWLLGYSPEGLPPPNEDFVVLLLKGIGIVAVALGYLFYVAARDPVRNVAVIDTLIFLCVAAAILEFYGAASLNIGAYYPGPYLLLRAIFQLIVAGLLLWWRPRKVSS